MLLEPLLTHARTKPDALAIRDDHGEVTYAQLLARSAALSGVIAGATTKDRVGILLPSGSAFAASFYGALLAKKAIVPINFLLSPQQVAHMVVDSGIDTILSVPMFAEKFGALPAKFVDVVASPAAGADGTPPAAPAVSPDALAVMLYTSGTSGMPKGVPLTHGNLHSTTDAAVKHIFRGSNHRFLGLVPLFHSTGFTGTLLAPMQLGAPVQYIGRFSPVATLKAIKDDGCDIVIAVPTMYGAMLNLKSATREDFAHVFALICGGEPLPGALRDAFEAKFGVPLLQGYGLSETCGPIAVNAPHARRDGSVGQILPGSAARISSEGEVELGGPGVMAGYHKLPDATREAMTPDGFFRTGDLGQVDDDGYLFITGRAKDMIIIGGEKLAPRELEEILGNHPSVADVAVVGKKDESRGEAAVAFVVAREGQTIDPAALKDSLKAKDLPNWKIPKEFVVVDELPRSPTGKVLKRELAARLATGE
jgi:long-chain acyl-CoA synthetase